MPPTPARRFKDAVFEQLSRVGRAVGSPKRLELLDLLAQAPRTVEVLADLAGMTLANTSQHLQVLRGARLVEADKEGLYVTYRLAEGVGPFYVQLRALAEARLPEVQATARVFLAERGEMERLDGAALLARALAGEVTVLDVRPAEEFAAGHLPQAHSLPLAELRALPLAELSARIHGLGGGREVVAYCRGPYCVFAVEAAQLLRRAGLVAHRLESGPPDWRAAGIPLAEGPAAPAVA